MKNSAANQKRLAELAMRLDRGMAAIRPTVTGALAENSAERFVFEDLCEAAESLWSLVREPDSGKD